MKISRDDFDKYMFPCYKPMSMVLTHGKGAHLYDDLNNSYLDFTAGIAVNSLGHANKSVVKIIRKQCNKLIHASNIFVNDKTLTLAKKLCQRTGYEKAFFANSGAEANECALKLARRVAFDNVGEEKCEIISFLKGFHGRTLFSVSVGGQDKYSNGFGPKPQGITHLPFNDLESFKKTISDKTCAVMLELIQGEGGIIDIDPTFLQGVIELAQKHQALIIVDEVQTGVGRTGTFYAYEQFGFRPDILTSAKGLGAGLPIGAVLTSTEIAKHFGPGVHGTTFGGNPLACAVAAYVVDKVGDNKFLDKVVVKGNLLREGLEGINERLHCFKSLRGRGLLQGLELTGVLENKAALVQECCAQEKLLVLLAGSNVVRLAPPLIIRKKELAYGLELLESALAKALEKAKE